MNGRYVLEIKREKPPLNLHPQVGGSVILMQTLYRCLTHRNLKFSRRMCECLHRILHLLHLHHHVTIDDRKLLHIYDALWCLTEFHSMAKDNVWSLCDLLTLIIACNWLKTASVCYTHDVAQNHNRYMYKPVMLHEDRYTDTSKTIPQNIPCEKLYDDDYNEDCDYSFMLCCVVFQWQRRSATAATESDHQIINRTYAQFSTAMSCEPLACTFIFYFTFWPPAKRRGILFFCLSVMSDVNLATK